MTHGGLPYAAADVHTVICSLKQHVSCSPLSLCSLVFGCMLDGLSVRSNASLCNPQL